MSCIPEATIRRLCTEFVGNCSVYLSIPSADEVFTFNADKKMNSASTIKTPLLALLFKDAEEGRINLDEPVPLGPDGIAGGSGVLKFLSSQIRLSLYDYATLMMIYSDNTATNTIIDTVGMDRANAFFAENGWNDTYLARKMCPPPSKLPKPTNFTSARDLGNILTRIYKKELISEEASSKMMSIMACQQVGKFDKALPSVWRPASAREPLTGIPKGHVALAQKGGTLGEVGIYHDSAIMLFPDGQCAILVVMTESHDEKTALEFIHAISRTVYDHMMPI